METNKLLAMGQAAKSASYALAACDTATKNDLLRSIATALRQAEGPICAANEHDVQEAKEGGMGSAMLDRLLLTPQRLDALAADVEAVCSLPDPVGRVLDGASLGRGLNMVRKRVPLGVVAVIYEARPNVTVDVATLCLKTGNAVILRGGKETRRTNEALVAVLRGVLAAHNLPQDAVQTITDPDRALVGELLRLDRYVDMVIPRGGAGLQRFCQENSLIPVILGGIGVCHIFVDATAKQPESLVVLENAKVQRPSVCNSVETVLVHAAIAGEFIPRMVAHLGALGVCFHATAQAMPFFAPGTATAVTEEALRSEWLTLNVNVHVVPGCAEALDHIREYGTGHSEAILTECMETAQQFVQGADAAAVFVNASTRFNDGGQFGLGAEVAVSTQKLHARGPLGLDALTTYKWIAQGNYTVR